MTAAASSIPDGSVHHEPLPSWRGKVGGDGYARGRLSLRATTARGHGRPVRGLDMQLPRLPAPDRERLRDAGGLKSAQVRVIGRFNDFARVSDEADQKQHVFHFCPDCGSQVFYTEPTEPDLVVVSVGSFADPAFPPPTESGYDSRRHTWLELPASFQRYAPELWRDSGLPLYEQGSYAEAAAKGRELIELRPDQAYLYF